MITAEVTSPYQEQRKAERRQRSRDRLKNKENKNNALPAESIKSTRLDDVLQPPAPPARTESRDIKEILASHRSRPRRPFNETRQNGVTSPPPMSPTPMSPPPMSPTPMSPPSTRRPSSPTLPAGGSDVLERLRARKASRERLNNKPGCCQHDRCKPEPENPDSGPRLHTWPCLSSRYDNKEEASPPPPPPASPPPPPPPPIEDAKEEPVLAAPPSPRPKTPVQQQTSPPDDLEKQALDSLEGLTSVIIKERDTARKERNEARTKCAAILNEYDGRQQAWQNQLNVVKIRLEHYARRHEKLRNDIVKQRETFDIERSRMKERHANQIEGLFGDLFDKIKSDTTYVGSQSGIDEVNYKLQAFMELWKGLAHDVDDLYDKEHYCLRLCETVKSMEAQIKHQNKIISSLAKGKPVEVPPTSGKTDLPAPNINVKIEDQAWVERVPSLPRSHNHDLPKFEELKKLDSLLPPEDGLSCEDILQQFAPIENTLDSLSLSLKRSVTTTTYTSPPPPEPEPLPKPSININKTIEDHNRLPDLPIELDPELIKNAPRNRTEEPVTPIEPFTSPKLFTPEAPKEAVFDAEPAQTTLPRETTIDDPAPKKKKKKKKKPVETEVDAPAVEPEVAPAVQALRPRSPSPTPSASSFRRRRASMESAKDFSIMGDDNTPLSPALSRNPLSPPPLPRSPPPLPRTPAKETTLDDPATMSPAPEDPAPPEEKKKKKKWVPSMPIFPIRKPKAPSVAETPPPAEEPAEEKSVTEPSGTASEEKTTEEEEEEAPPPPPPSRPKRAKSLPRFRDPSLPRNMASANMKRANSKPCLRKDPGSEYNSDEESETDSDIRSMIESVYMPLHLTPSRASSRKNVADDAKSEASSFARRNKMPASMGWLDANKGDSEDDSDESESSEESDESDEESDEESEESDEEDEEEEEDGEDGNTSDVENKEEQDALGPPPPIPPRDDEDYRNSMLSSILKDFDEDSKDWMNDSFTPAETPRAGEILI